MALPRKIHRPDSSKAASTQLKTALRSVGVAFVTLAITSFVVLMSSSARYSGLSAGDKNAAVGIEGGYMSKYGEMSQPLKVYMYPVRRDLNWALLHVRERERERERDGGREEG